MTRSAFTVATGSQVYLDFAIALARSFLLHNRSNGIRFFIFTDLDCRLPPDLEGVELVRISEGAIGKGIASKLFLDRLAPTEASLFIDSDCLCYGSLTGVFERFSGRAVSVVGFLVSTGEWCGARVEDLCNRFQVEQVPRFNGGVYYIERGAKATEIYDTARCLLPSYDELGFARHRGWANEEPLMTLALAVHGASPVQDDGTIMSDLASSGDRAKVNVLTGSCHLFNPARPDPRNKWWYDFLEYSPRIIHYAGGSSTTFPYTKERALLSWTRGKGIPGWCSNAMAALAISGPYWIRVGLKSMLRPAYRAVFGNRAIRKSDRPFNE